MAPPTRVTGRVVDPVHIIGLSSTVFSAEQDAMLDELVFEAVHAALRECGLRKQDVGLSVTASMDVTDGRSISAGLTNAASGGYLNDSYRVEGDGGVAITAAAQAVAAGDVEVAVAVAVHNPETSSRDVDTGRAFLRQISNLAFEPHFDRPLGLTSDVIYALHAAHAINRGVITLAEMAQIAAEEIGRGSARSRAVRTTNVSAEQVLESTPVAWPLHELMLPASTTGAAAVVLASPARAGRTTGRSARITGMGHATGHYTWTGAWLTDPGAPTRRAANMAYRNLDVPDGVATSIDAVELSAPTPALLSPYLDALGLDPTTCTVNPSGGVRSAFPGLANGVMRLIEAIQALEGAGINRALAHSVDTVTGTVSEDVTVFVVEAAS